MTTAASSIRRFLIDTQRISRTHPSSVDHFHWRGHVGCSSDYSLHKYATPLITNINSQVNEQANTGLQCIKGQIAYMKPDDFMFHVQLFLNIANMDKRGKIDVGKSSL